MPEFDPIKIFKRMWFMKWWGSYLVVSAIIMTALAIFVSIIDATNIKAMLVSWSLSLGLWVILLVSYISITSKLKMQLDDSNVPFAPLKLQNEINRVKRKIKLLEILLEGS